MYWMERRIRSFSTPLGLAAQDMLVGDLQPPLAFCQRFNAEVKVFWRVRRLFFMNILGMSSRSHLLAQGMRVTRTLLRGAELSNWIYILHWIILLNPDLLMWNELSKFIPMLVAASLKYAELGELAPWCKLILPIEELTEFRADNLNVPYAVAQGIASEFGTGSNRNLVGAEKDPHIKNVVKHAIYIVKVAGGAKTVDVMALRQWRYNGYQNPRLESALNTGAENETVDEMQEEVARGGAEEMLDCS
ncbi:hypothetical protein J6590_102841 [Homalodisca vitripennis]|nr:hypothetical protein J6590_102841 [Homalodisca vitripennis]